MLLQCIRERLINLFAIARPAFQLLDERLNGAPISGLEVSAVPITVLAKRHGRVQTGALCALVESVAFLCFLSKHGIEAYIVFTVPLLASRLHGVIYVTFVYIATHLLALGLSIIAYLGSTCLGMKLKRPILRITRLLHTTILSNIFGPVYLQLAKDYCKALHDYALHQAEKRIYKPCKERVVKMKKSSSFASFFYHRLLELIIIPVLNLSVTCAFLFVYVTADIDSPQPVFDDDAQEVSNTIGSSVPSTDTTSTAVDTSPSENARSVLEITQSEDTAAAVGLLDEMQSFKDAQHSSEAIEDEVLRGAVVDEDLVLQDVAEEKVADEEAPIPEIVKKELVDELSEAEEPVDDAVPCVDEHEEVVAEFDVVAEAEVVDTDAADVREVLEDESLCYVPDSSAEVTGQAVLGEEEVEELEEEEIESVDVDEDVEQVSGDMEEVEEAVDEVDGEEVDYAEESGEIEEAEFVEEVSSEAEEEYEQVEEEEVSGEAEEEVEYADEFEQEKSEEVEEVFEYDEEPRRVEPDLYVPQDDAEYPIDEPQQEEEDPNAVEGLGWNSIRVNLSAESLVSATIDHANMGLVTTIETECVIMNIVASSTVASLEREAGEVEEEVEEPKREVDGSEVAVEKVEPVKVGQEETSVREGLADKAVIPGDGPDQTGTQSETEAEKERLLKQCAREIARKMAKGGVLNAEEKAILLSSYSRKDSAAETKSAQLEVNGGVSSAANRVTSDVEGVKGGDEAVSTRPASSSPNASTADTPQAEAVIGVASADVQMEEKHLDAEAKDDEPERPELMQVKSPRVEFRSRALSLDAIVGMEALSFSSLALGGVSNAFEIPTGLANGASSSLSRRTLSLGEWAAAPIIPVIVETPRWPLKTIHRRRRHMSLP
ncbi:hypothetical protein D9613_012479 [Agrocybe pediades]|uniref:Uncharacterized protein n=1 Tax=Agrocybe pediades TaxID=84607 RepID=A0A8H4QR32_9AGAR|nr:hypothetical protein D9613_012479 [Agrocybe pediades]